ncbi:MAG: Ser/Thr protein kinase [Gammaproteobacteria bacterium]|nr:MAG: Ser/Thr protein kinase [Gammaproteobacteria bacterium]
MIALKKSFAAVLLTVLIGFSATALSAPTATLIPFWEPHNEKNTATIDHSLWQSILSKYIVSPHKSGVNRFDYGRVSDQDKSTLTLYLNTQTALNPRKYSRAEQKAYWINLYNALTVNLIIQAYPAESITKLGESFFSFGPWDDVITEVQGQELTLNNIEHGILRPIYKDNRIHYAVNCASYGCPNLSQTAYTAENTNALLNTGAHAYVNHQRGVHFNDEQLVVSSIFHWYKVDFGDSNETLLMHLSRHAEPELAKRLDNYQGEVEHIYDWSLNKP